MGDQRAADTPRAKVYDYLDLDELERLIRPSYYTINARLLRRLWLWARKQPHVPQLHGEPQRPARPMTLREAITGVILPSDNVRVMGGNDGE